MKLPIYCVCGKRFFVEATQAKSAVKCPHCGTAVAVVNGTPEPPPPPVVSPPVTAERRAEYPLAPPKPVMAGSGAKIGVVIIGVAAACLFGVGSVVLAAVLLISTWVQRSGSKAVTNSEEPVSAAVGSGPVMAKAIQASRSGKANDASFLAANGPVATKTAGAPVTTGANPQQGRVEYPLAWIPIPQVASKYLDTNHVPDLRNDKPIERELKAALELARRLDDGGLVLVPANSLRITGIKIVGRFKAANALEPLAELGNLPILDLAGVDQQSVHDESLRPIGGLKKLQILNLDGVRLHAENMAFLSQLESLRELSLKNSRVTDDHLRHIANLTNLEALTLDGCFAVSGEGMVNVSRLTKLTKLSLKGTSAGLQYSLPHLRGLTLLTDIDPLFPNPDHRSDYSYIYNLKQPTGFFNGSCEDSRIPGSVLENIREWKGITSLNLQGIAARNQDIKHLSGLVNLKRLYLTGTDITEAGFESLMGLKQLEYLSLRDTHIKDGNELNKVLYRLPTLTEVDIGDTHLDGLDKIALFNLHPRVNFQGVKAKPYEINLHPEGIGPRIDPRTGRYIEREVVECPFCQGKGSRTETELMLRGIFDAEIEESAQAAAREVILPHLFTPKLPPRPDGK